MADEEGLDLSLGLGCGASSAKPKGTHAPPENQDSGEKKPAEVVDVFAQEEQSFQKKLTSTDLNSLRILWKDFKKCIEPILREGENAEKGIPVSAPSQEGKLFTMHFNVVRHSEMKDGWREFATSHHLQIGDVVTMRMSRNLEDSRLWLDVWKMGTPGAGPSGSPGKRVRPNDSKDWGHIGQKKQV